ncbi:MAG: cytochrome c [Pseudomonadota bacterium]
MRRRALILVTVTLVAGAALAHEGVKNPAVMERMQSMKTIAAQLEILGPMSKQPDAFDAAKASTALNLIALETERTVSLFEAKEDDPKSEARAEIWQAFDDFTVKADALQTAAENAQAGTMEELQATMRALGATCKECHRLYRE